MRDVLNGKFNAPLYSLSSFSRATQFTYDQFIFGAIFCFANGVTAIPLTLPGSSKQTLVITCKDVIKFIIDHSTELLGSIKSASVVSSGLLKQASTVTSSRNFGSALYILASRKVDSALVLDEDSKICGVVTTQAILKIWWLWVQQTHPRGELLALEDLKADYLQGVYQPYDPEAFTLYNSVSFLTFSILMTPLNMCDEIAMLPYKSFQKYIRRQLKQRLVSMHLLLPADDSSDEEHQKNDSDSSSDSRKR
jgi:hypothetical protein